MPYQDLGYDEYFDKSLNIANQSITNANSDILLEGISGESLSSTGAIQSLNKQMSMDLDNNTFTINDGTIERLRLGTQVDGSVGLKIVDQDGNVLFNITGKTNLIQSPSGKFRIDLTKERAESYDDFNLRAIFGKIK